METTKVRFLCSRMIRGQHVETGEIVDLPALEARSRLAMNECEIYTDEPVKRKRGRPRKVETPESAVEKPEA